MLKTGWLVGWGGRRSGPVQTSKPVPGTVSRAGPVFDPTRLAAAHRARAITPLTSTVIRARSDRPLEDEQKRGEEAGGLSGEGRGGAGRGRYRGDGSGGEAG